MPLSKLESAVWTRQPAPILAAQTLGQPWASVTCYSPSVLRVGQQWHLWFVGNHTGSRGADHSLGHATSRDGRHWVPDAANPVMTPGDLPFGSNWQTPCVRYDAERGIFRMWFVTTTEFDRDLHPDGRQTVRNLNQALAYAESRDGRAWTIHPEPLYPNGRGPSVWRLPTGEWVLWMASRPSPAHPWGEGYAHIYRFTSPDGLRWQRDAEPAIRPTGITRSCVYCAVLPDEAGGWLMLHGAHYQDQGSQFGIFLARSRDGRQWTCQHQAPLFAPSPEPTAFDGRYTSTPCLVREADRLQLYYSARNRQVDYRDLAGNLKRDGSGVYDAIGVASTPL